MLEGEAPSFAGYTHVVLNRVPFSPTLEAAIRDAEGSGARVLFDVDDLIFDRAAVADLDFVKARPETDRGRLLEAVNGIARTIARCGSGLCATPALRRELENGGRRAHVALNGVSDEMVRLSDQATAERARGTRAVRIGFPSGHPGHDFNLPVAAEALATVLARRPGVTVVLIGPVALPARLLPWAERIERLPYVDWRRLPFELARLDICIAPLADNRFNRCKSDIKLLEAALVRVPLVASPVGQLGETIRAGVDGLLADGLEGWVEALSSLLDAPDRRAALAEAAAEKVRRERSSRALGPGLAAALGDTRA